MQVLNVSRSSSVRRTEISQPRATPWELRSCVLWPAQETSLAPLHSGPGPLAWAILSVLFGVGIKLAVCSKNMQHQNVQASGAGAAKEAPIEQEVSSVCLLRCYVGLDTLACALGWYPDSCGRGGARSRRVIRYSERNRGLTFRSQGQVGERLEAVRVKRFGSGGVHLRNLRFKAQSKHGLAIHKRVRSGILFRIWYYVTLGNVRV